MGKTHAADWPDGSPSPAQLKEFFAQVASGRMTKWKLQSLLYGSKEDVILHDLIKDLNLDWVHPDINQESFPVLPRNEDEYDVDLGPSYVKPVIINKALLDIAKSEDDSEPADILDLCRRCKKNPEEQITYSIVAPRSIWLNPRSGRLHVPILYASQGKRILGIIEDFYFGSDCFVLIRRPKKSA